MFSVTLFMTPMNNLFSEFSVVDFKLCKYQMVITCTIYFYNTKRYWGRGEIEPRTVGLQDM